MISQRPRWLNVVGVLGVIALNQIKQSGEQGRGFAIAGIVIGGIVLALNLLFIILYLVTKSYSYT